MQSKPVNLREQNLALLMHQLREKQALSRAQLAQLTALNRSTISSLVDELVALNLLHETGWDESPGNGRPGRLLEINPHAGYALGCEVGISQVRAVITDLGGAVHWRAELPFSASESQEAILLKAFHLIHQAGAAGLTPLLGLGFTLPGWLDNQRQNLILSPNLQWRDVPIAHLLRSQVSLPVFVENDANAAALAEHFFGEGRTVRDFLLLRAGVGIGGGLFLDGALYRGARGMAGEIGHINLKQGDERPCRCGKRGCWEIDANTLAAVNRARMRLEVGQQSVLTAWLQQPETSLDFALLVQAAEAGDAVAQESLAETGYALGLGLGNLVNIFNPSHIFLAGAMSSAGAFLLPSLAQGLAATALPELGHAVELSVSQFGADAIVMGAASLVVQHVLDNPKQVGNGR